MCEFCGRNAVHEASDATVAIDGVPRASREIAGCEWGAMTKVERMPTSVATQAIAQFFLQNDERIPFVLAECPAVKIDKNLHG